MRRSLPLVLAVAASASLVACGGQPPSLLAIGDQSGTVGVVLQFDLLATDPDTRILDFSADRLPPGATIEKSGDTQARFRWVPTAADEGDTQVDFIVSDGRNQDTERVILTIAPSGGGGGPEFVGQTTWTLEDAEKSLEKIIEVRDDSTSTIDWSISGQPTGATFTPLLKRAVFFWEPTTAQRAQAQYSFTVTATNPDSGRSRDQVFTILIRSGGGTCTTNKPSVVSTTPDPVEGPNDFQVTATITDSESSIQSASVEYAFGNDPQPADFLTLNMTGSGTLWSATLRRGTDLGPGEFETVTYEICARDDDDATGDTCDQEGCTGRLTFVARVGAGKGLCETCTTSSECGSAVDECVTTTGTCATDCSGGGGCPSGYVCLDFQTGGIFQCVPDNPGFICGASGAPAAVAGDLTINEILADPPAGSDANGDTVSSTTADEFVEIVSLAAGTVDLGGYTVSDSVQVRFTFPIGTELAAGEAILIFGGGDPSTFTGLGNAQVFALSANPSSGSFGLNNTGDQVQIRNPNFDLIVGANYGSEANANQSITLDPQVTGFSFVQHGSAPGSIGPYSPGVQSCGNAFPISVGGACAGGSACGATTPDADVEPNNDTTNPGCIAALPVLFTGDLEYHGGATKPGPDPWDYYLISLEGGRLLDVLLGESGNGLNVDTVVKILDSTGALLKENDDAGEDNPPITSLYSEIDNFPVPSTGTYFIAVGTYPGISDQIGQYDLLVSYQ